MQILIPRILINLRYFFREPVRSHTHTHSHTITRHKTMFASAHACVCVCVCMCFVLACGSHANKQYRLCLRRNVDVRAAFQPASERNTHVNISATCSPGWLNDVVAVVVDLVVSGETRQTRTGIFSQVTTISIAHKQTHTHMCVHVLLPNLCVFVYVCVCR